MHQNQIQPSFPIQSSPHKRGKQKSSANSKINSNLQAGSLVTNHNLHKIINNKTSQPNSFDPSQFRGVTDNAGGVFGMAKREVTEFE